MPATYVLADSQIYLSADIHVEQNNNMLNSKVGYFKSKDEKTKIHKNHKMKRSSHH